MFSFLRRLFGGRRPRRPRLTFELRPDERVSVSCDWPDTRNASPERTALIAENTALMIRFAARDLFRHLVHQAVAVRGDLGGDPETATRILEVLVALEREDGDGLPEDEEESPLVSPENVFGSPGGMPGRRRLVTPEDEEDDRDEYHEEDESDSRGEGRR